MQQKQNKSSPCAGSSHKSSSPLLFLTNGETGGVPDIRQGHSTRPNSFYGESSNRRSSPLLLLTNGETGGLPGTRRQGRSRKRPNSLFGDHNSTTSNLQMLLLTHGDNGRRMNMNMTMSRRPVYPSRSSYGNPGYGSLQKVPLPTYNYNMDPNPALSLGPFKSTFKSVGGRSTGFNKTRVIVDPLWTPYCLLSGNVRLFGPSSNNPLPSYNYRSQPLVMDDPLELTLGPYKSMGRKKNKTKSSLPWLNGRVTKGRTSTRHRVAPSALENYDGLELSLGPSKFVEDRIVVTRGTGNQNIQESMSCTSVLAKLLKEKKHNRGGCTWAAEDDDN